VTDFSGREEKFKFIFNLFDLAGNGKIDRDKLKRMTVAIASLPPTINSSAASTTSSQSAPLTLHQFDVTKEFSPLLDLFSFFSLFLFDRDGDRALSYPEWRRYCEEDSRIVQMIQEINSKEAKNREKEKIQQNINNTNINSSLNSLSSSANEISSLSFRSADLEPSHWEDYRDKMRTAAGLINAKFAVS